MSPSLPDGTRLRVTAGNPTPTEVAALVVALDAGGRAPSPERSGDDTPAWARAGRREALGLAPVASPGDLRRPW